MAEKTATETSMKDREDAWRERALHDRIEWFLREWSPEDRDDAARFNADFHTVVQMIYADMTKPVERALLTTLNTAMPKMFMPFVENPERN